MRSETDKTIGRLSPRQREVMRLTCENEETTKSIALLLRCSVKTVEYHRSQIYRRLLVNNPIALFKKALQLGLISLETDPRRQQFPGFQEPTPPPQKPLDDKRVRRKTVRVRLVARVKP